MRLLSGGCPDPRSLAPSSLICEEEIRQTLAEQTITLTWQDVRTRQALVFSGTLPITIGRCAEDNMISLNSRLVSSSHARLEWQEGGILLTDLASHNGTAVEGFSINCPTTLTNGSRFQIGAFNFVITIGNEAPKEQTT